MRLHHFCRASDLDSIAEKGLYPHVAHEALMSLGHEVVWLSSAETTGTTEEDVEHYRHCFLDLRGDWLQANGDVVMIVNENGMARANDAGELYAVRHVAAALSPRALREWWVYFGGIPPSKIEGLPPRTKPKLLAEHPALDTALDKFIRSETATWAPPGAVP
jgi:hypothetical protein